MDIYLSALTLFAFSWREGSFATMWSGLPGGTMISLLFFLDSVFEFGFAV